MAFTMVTSCPLCLALSDPEDMLDIEIERIVPKGRAHVLLCRSCGSQVVRAMAKAGEPLAQELIDLDKKEAGSELAANYPCVKCGNLRTEDPGSSCTEPEYHKQDEEQSDDNSAA